MAWRKTSSRVGVRRVSSLIRAPGSAEGEGYVAHGRYAICHTNGQGILVYLDLLHLLDWGEGLGRGLGVAFDGCDDDVGADAALELGGGALGDELARG